MVENVYPTRETIVSLAGRLGLPLPGPFTQDWEYEVADPSKISEWLEVYESGKLNHDERSLLMTLLLTSHNEALENGSDQQNNWAKIRGFLERDRSIHQKAIQYWSLPDEADLENCFAITPLVRTINT